MSIYEREYVRAAPQQGSAVADFASQVYGWMTIGLAVTAVMAWGLIRSGVWMSLVPYWWVCGLATLGIALAMNGLVQRVSFPAMAGLFLSYSAIQGAFFGLALPLYAASVGGQVIWVAFGTASVIAASAWAFGTFSKTDLTHLGPLLRFGLMALIGVTVVYVLMSFFVNLTFMHLVISWVGLVLFIGLTAYDAQQIRQMSYQVTMQHEMAPKLSLMMALRMYINVIMIFWYLLQILSSRRN